MGQVRLLAVGRVAGAFGVRGEVRISTFTEEPLALARFGELKRPVGSPALTITTAREPKGAFITRSAGDILEIIPDEGGPTWYLPFTREAVPEVRLADGLIVAVRPNEVE